MGNEGSKLKGLVIDKNAVEANDFWALYNAESPNTSSEDGRQLLSVFQGEPVVSGQLWVQQGPMERAIKNLMIYRHPYILKYVSTWEQGGQKHLATQRVRPLSAIMPTLSDIQVCLGLRTILCSLIFLIEKAMARHLNICIASIYVTDNGSWRLAGFEYVWKHKEVTKALLDLANAYRHKPAIDPLETKELHSDAIEQYAFATLCEEILAKCTKSDNAIPHMQEFREYCTAHLKHKNVQLRPKLSAVLLHPYFNHEFVLIHSFLFELPLKSVHEKQDFFTGLIDRLRYFNEEVVGAHLAADLLSRMVLLDPTAQLCVTPYVLKTKTDISSALFSNYTYTRHLMPHIKKMFRLRDAQIRLILLEYFMEYVRLLTEEEIREFILPHLLAGMNDTNDVLVAKTLRCLADLVPILGAAAVIGGQRSRLFSDGRPQAAVPDSDTIAPAAGHWVEPRSITPVMGDSEDCMVSDSPLPPENIVELMTPSKDEETSAAYESMPPRLSPDGGEDDKRVSADLVDPITANVVESFDLTTADAIAVTVLSNGTAAYVGVEDADDPWSDWETDDLVQRLSGNVSNSNNGDPEQDLQGISSESQSQSLNLLPQSQSHTSIELTPTPSSSSYLTLTSHTSHTDSFRTAQSSATSSAASSLLPSAKPQPTFNKTINDDLDALDIKVQPLSTPANDQSEEFDFFKDMEPVIETKSNIYDLSNNNNNNNDRETNNNNFLKGIDDNEDEILIDSSRFASIDFALKDNEGGVGNEIAEGDGWIVDDEEDALTWLS